MQISNISALKRIDIQFTTWCVVPNEMFDSIFEIGPSISDTNRFVDRYV